jgi:hypothetical protein
MASVHGGNIPNMFHRTLGAVWSSELEKTEPKWKGYLEEKSTDKRWFDDVEMVDPGLWSETDEGNTIDLDDFSEGIVVRYRPIKFGKRLVIPEEIEEDAVYDEAYDATRMLVRTCVQTQDYYAVGILDDAANTNVVGGDGVTLANASHKIKGGSTVSNILSPALSPSNTAVQTMLIACEKMIGGNGYIVGITLKNLFGPSNQKFRFKEILKSEKRDDTANNAINALKGELSDTYFSVPHMASTTNWFGRTNVMRGAMFVWRRKPRFRNSPSQRDETKEYTGSARFIVSWTNWRTYMASLA